MHSVALFLVSALIIVSVPGVVRAEETSHVEDSIDDSSKSDVIIPSPLKIANLTSQKVDFPSALQARSAALPANAAAVEPAKTLVNSKNQPVIQRPKNHSKRNHKKGHKKGHKKHPGKKPHKGKNHHPKKNHPHKKHPNKKHPNKNHKNQHKKHDKKQKIVITD